MIHLRFPPTHAHAHTHTFVARLPFSINRASLFRRRLYPAMQASSISFQPHWVSLITFVSLSPTLLSLSSHSLSSPLSFFFALLRSIVDQNLSWFCLSVILSIDEVRYFFVTHTHTKQTPGFLTSLTATDTEKTWSTMFHDAFQFAADLTPSHSLSYSSDPQTVAWRPSSFRSQSAAQRVGVHRGTLLINMTHGAGAHTWLKHALCVGCFTLCCFVRVVVVVVAGGGGGSGGSGGGVGGRGGGG